MRASGVHRRADSGRPTDRSAGSPQHGPRRCGCSRYRGPHRIAGTALTTSPASEQARAEYDAKLVAAWNRYLWATCGASGAAYQDCEERAWERLVHELSELGCKLPS